MKGIPEVVSCSKNQNLFLVRLRDGAGAVAESEDLLNLIVEVPGEPQLDKAAKTAAARDLWIPAVDSHGGFGRWGFLEITDPWDVANTMRAYMASKASAG